MTASTCPIVLVHGLWMTPRSFDGWVARYRAAGYEVHAPAWPGLAAPVGQLRRDPTPIARLTISTIIDHYARIIGDLPAPPIIMGHSFGGAFTQVLLDRGLGAAGVAIHTAGVKGVRRLPLSTLRSGWPILRSPLNRSRAVPISLKQFHWRFTNHLSVADSAPIYEEQCIPAVGHVLFEGASANLNPRAAIRVDFGNGRRAPLLFIAGTDDRVSPPALVRSNVRRYRKSGAVTDFKSFPGRVHYTMGQRGWEDVADFALEWATAHVDAATATAGDAR